MFTDSINVNEQNKLSDNTTNSVCTKLITTQSDYMKYIKDNISLLNDNIVEIYCSGSKQYYYKNNNDNDIKRIIAANFDDHKMYPHELLKSLVDYNNLLLVGNFYDENSYKNFKKSSEVSINKPNKIIHNFRTPIIAILSTTKDCDKMVIQLAMNLTLRKKGIKVENICANSCGMLFGMDVINFDEKVIYPDFIMEVNNRIEFLDAKESDLIIISVQGGIFPYDYRANSYNMGIVPFSYLNACSFDYVILAVNQGYPVEMIAKNLDLIKACQGDYPDSIVIADTLIDSSTINFFDSFESFSLLPDFGKTHKQKLYNLCKKYKTALFDISEVKEGVLIKDIYDKLS